MPTVTAITTLFGIKRIWNDEPWTDENAPATRSGLRSRRGPDEHALAPCASHFPSPAFAFQPHDRRRILPGFHSGGCGQSEIGIKTHLALLRRGRAELRLHE